MILARCPHCETTFRAEPEALKQRAGKVRCGKCRRVFNALDHLVADPLPATPAVTPLFSLTPPPLDPGEDPGMAEASDRLEVTAVGDHDAAGRTEADAAPSSEPLPAADPLLDGDDGLVAARDSRDIPGYSKWAEGTLSAPPAHFDEGHRTGWLIVLGTVVLGLMLLIQVVHYWRMEIAMRWPDTRPWLEEACRSANCTVPYPRDANLINLEASELQIDPERGNMLVLNLTVKNRAPFAQEFPAIELTLTDSHDNVVVRRILSATEWLPELDRSASVPGALPVSTPPAFPANKEIAARLWIDARDTGAVGYRVFVFYP